ncbi:MAG: sulfatase-like hydrolase/transferase, partial [Cyclobacteriaceae bacterium]|nr:sulfatase-like hydrolase/transferase [Cyclobacteriaceae bacterium]
AAMISRMDKDMGKMIQLIKDLGLEENTLIIFTSDNVWPLNLLRHTNKSN